MTELMFPDHTMQTAPPASRRLMAATSKKLGHVPAAVARLASSPHLLEGFLTVSRLFEAATLEPVAREVVVMTVATRNGCEVCIAMHTARLAELAADPLVVAALLDQRPLPEERLEAVRRFALEVMDTAGDVAPSSMRALLEHGYTVQNALEVVLGLGAYTMSTLANRLTGAPVDHPR